MVQLTPDGHADMPSQLSDLGQSLSDRFQCTGDLTNIVNAISANQRAVQLTPDGDAQMPSRLNKLGISYALRFQCTGDFTDIADAILVHHQVVQLAPDEPSGWNNLGNSLLERFEHTGDLTNIANAISAHQRAVQLTSDDDTDMPSRLNNLGNSFMHCFGCTDDLAIIASATSAYKRAFQLTPNGHPEMPGLLNNLGISLSEHFKHTDNLTHIANAIEAQQLAIQLTLDGHPNKPQIFNNLGTSFLHCFEHTGDLTDIANAISAYQRAVQLTPNGHANRPGLLNNLGRSFLQRFQHTGDFSDATAATSNYQQSAMHKSGPPSIRLIAAQRWAQLSASHNPTDSLEAYAVVVNLLSQIASMDRTIQQRHSSLIRISRLTASAAFAQGELGKALKWLEQGRCLVWSQLNQLRTPVDDLRTHNHLLADRFLRVSRALELSGSCQELTSLTLSGTISQKVALEDEARTHVMLAQDWEQLLKEICGIPAFHNFLRPRTASNIMKHLPRDGPVILVNVHEDRCDALALIPNCRQPLHIPLNNLTHQYASVLRDQLRSYLLTHGRRMRAADLDLDRATRPAPKPNAENGNDIHKALQELWRLVVKPVLDALAYPVSLKSIISY